MITLDYGCIQGVDLVDENMRDNKYSIKRIDYRWGKTYWTNGVRTICVIHPGGHFLDSI